MEEGGRRRRRRDSAASRCWGTLAALRAIARRLKIKNYKTYSKEALIDILLKGSYSFTARDLRVFARSNIRNYSTKIKSELAKILGIDPDAGEAAGSSHETEEEAIQDLGVQMKKKKKQEESEATILSLQATLANVESQKIALEKEQDFLREELLMVKRKEHDKKIIANMLDALSKCVQTFGQLLDDNQARSILDEIKQAITAGASRKGERAERTNTEEEKQVFYQVVEVLGSLVKILKASFLPSIDELSSYLMPMLAKDKTAEERRNAIRAFDDVADQCPEAEYHSVFAFWFSYDKTYLPSLLEACNDESSDLRKAAVYGLGVCAEHGGSVIKPLIGEALSRLNAVIRDPNALHPDNVMAYDNAVSALGKICYFHCDSIDSAQVIPVWLNCLPIKGDVIEAKAVHDLLSVMIERSDAELLGLNNQYLPKIFSIFAEILCAGKDLASDQTRCRIIEILRQFQQTLPPATLASIWSTLQPQQQSALQSILSS